MMTECLRRRNERMHASARVSKRVSGASIEQVPDRCGIDIRMREGNGRRLGSPKAHLMCFSALWKNVSVGTFN